MFSCPYCVEYSVRTFKKLLHHIKYLHSNEPNFRISCGHCNQSFRKFESFKSHLRRKHNVNENTGENDLNLQDVQHELDDLLNVDGNDQEEDGGETEGENIIDKTTRFIALFVLKTKEENQLSQPTVDAILDNTESLLEQSLQVFKNDVRSCLSENGIDLSHIGRLNEVLEEPSIFSKAVHPVANEYLQKKYFVEKFNFVEPRTVVLGRKPGQYKMRNGQLKLTIVKETYQYIPILKTLKALLNHPDILDEVYNTHTSTDGLFRDFCDGQDFKEHPLFGSVPHALVLHGYYDEFQVTNALGSKTKINKLGAFYFTLGNLRPHFRSSVNSIQLFVLCKVIWIKKYGIDKILQPFMEDINCLESESGVKINIGGIEKVFRGSIGPFSGDNLGLHLIGGFSESFNTFRICRICLATKDDIQVKFSEQEFQLRTRESHERHCILVKDDATLSRTYGVKRKSVLNQSLYFHVVDGLDLDIMHDQLEGVLPLEIKMLLQKYVKADKSFTLKTVNERIQSFNYGLVDGKNKPSPLKDDVLTSDSGSISQTATQMWCLSRMFPLIIGDLVPHDQDGHWSNFLKLLQIEEIIFAPRTSTQLAAYLSVLVQEYLETFSELYTRNLIPKQHFMVHYPRQIIRRGPLVRNWAMRFEAKHGYFKKLVNKINNFKNIDLSLAKRHQALQAYLLQGSSGTLIKSSLQHGKGQRTTTVGDSNLAEKLLGLHCRICRTSTLTMNSWVNVFGTKYAVGCVIVPDLIHGHPRFGKVDQIMVVDGSIVLFKYKTLHVLEYEEHLNSYRVELVNDENLAMQDCLIDYHPLGLHKGFGCHANKLFVVLHHRIDCMQ